MFSSRPDKTAKPRFCQYQRDTNNDKFSYRWENYSERNGFNNLYLLLKTVIIRLTLNSYLILISRRDVICVNSHLF